jgi:beta-glucosidase
MKTHFITALIFIMFFSVKAQSTTAEKEAKAVQFAKSLLSKMTLEEKVGQMTQVTIQTISKTQGTKSQHHELDLAKLEEAITKYHVGSLLNVYDIANELDYWHEIIAKIQDVAINKTRLKIPVLYGIDAIHGATYTKGATLFPQSLAMASTFNRELERQAGKITSREVRASGIPWNFYPVLDLGRQPLWPRLWETFGEDVYLTTEMGKSYITGAQGSDISAEDKLAVCLKHYAGYSFPLNGKDRTPAWIGERMMREYFLPPFKAAVDAGAETIMINSAEVDGIPGHANYHLLTEVLRNEWKFKGFTVSDWEDIKRLYTRDRVADSPEEAVRMAVMAGIDMSMVPYDFSFYEILIKLVNDGKVPMSRINEAVERILRVKYLVGLFDNPKSESVTVKTFASKENKQINLDAAREAVVLLKNEKNILPLKKGNKILVAGPTANMLSVLNGGWTITWQGNEETAYPQENNTILEALKIKAGDENVNYVEGCGFDKDINTSKAVEEAKKSDVVILCLGEPTYCETPGNINDLTLNAAQLNLAKEISATGKPVVLVLIEGRPRLINSIESKMNAILVSFLPGMEGGNAIAEILFGETNPSGKLPVTYPKFPNDIVHYDYKPIEVFDTNVFDPQWSFGHGLSYTAFKYSNLTLSNANPKIGENVIVKVDVENTGNVTGKESVLLYLTDLYGTVSRPNKQLKGFEKISLKPGEKRTVEFTLTDEMLSFVGLENKFVIEPGEFIVSVGDQKVNFNLTK